MKAGSLSQLSQRSFLKFGSLRLRLALAYSAWLKITFWGQSDWQVVGWTGFGVRKSRKSLNGFFSMGEICQSYLFMSAFKMQRAFSCFRHYGFNWPNRSKSVMKKFPQYCSDFKPFCTSLPLASTTWVWSTFSSHCPFSSYLRHWLTSATSTIFSSEKY